MKIFDIGAGQGSRFLSTQDDIYKLVSNNNSKGPQSANTTKALRPITYIEPPEPTFKDDARSDLS